MPPAAGGSRRVLAPRADLPRLALCYTSNNVDRCEHCLFQRRLCLCAEIPALATRTRIVIVRHHSERLRSSNSGRLAHRALSNSILISHGGLDGPAALSALELRPERTWLLFPEGEPQTAPPEQPPHQLVVLDATWSQARRMYRKLDALRGLPILRLPDTPMPAARLRESPAPGRVSTIEAIARALRLIEGDEPARALERLFDLAVARAAASGRVIA